MAESKKLPLVPTPTLDVAAQGEAITRPALGTNTGNRTEKLNAEYKDSEWFRALQKEAASKGWTREQLDKAVMEHGVR